MSDPFDDFDDELRNFQEIASFLNPSPGEIPELDGVEICGLSMPLREMIGGDHIIYMDFKRRYDLPKRIARAEEANREKVVRNLRDLERRAGILVADVSGHRMTDAMIAAMLHQAFLLGAYYELDMDGELTTRLFEHINTRVYRTTAINKYVTMIYGEIFEDGTFRFLSAGHQPPAVFSREFGRFMPISEDRLVSVPPVGMFQSSADPDARLFHEEQPETKRYEINEISLLSPGDILLLYTDGLQDHDGGDYFPGEVERLLTVSGSKTAEEICDELRQGILARGAPVDDISVVVIRKSPES